MPNMLLVLPVVLDKQDSHSLYIYPQGDVIVFAKVRHGLMVFSRAKLSMFESCLFFLHEASDLYTTVYRLPVFANTCNIMATCFLPSSNYCYIKCGYY